MTLSHDPDIHMRAILFGFKLFAMAYLGYLLLFLCTGYDPSLPGYHPPFALWTIDTINLFIHEAGHLFFKLFGQFIYILGGSLFQILVPLALLIVVWRQNPGQIWYPGFWTGESMVNVSAYIKDAPYRKLTLLTQGLIHDWNWLLNGDHDAAEIIGGIVYWLGILICAGALGAGVYFAIRDFRQDSVSVPPNRI